MVTAEPLTATTTLEPTAPGTIEESGLSVDLILQLVLKTIFFAGQYTGTQLAEQIHVNFQILEPAIDTLVEQHHLAIVDGGIIGRSSFTYRITDAGRERADLFLQNNHYVGAAPVPLAQYQAYMENLEKSEHQHVSRAALREVVARQLVVSDKVLDQLGPAINSRHSLFLYGPPGNGKSVIATAMGELLRGGIEIPHALEVAGSIIRIFDPVHHEPTPVEPTMGRVSNWARSTTTAGSVVSDRSSQSVASSSWRASTWSTTRGLGSIERRYRPRPTVESW